MIIGGKNILSDHIERFIVVLYELSHIMSEEQVIAWEMEIKGHLSDEWGKQLLHADESPADPRDAWREDQQIRNVKPLVYAEGDIDTSIKLQQTRSVIKEHIESIEEYMELLEEELIAEPEDYHSSEYLLFHIKHDLRSLRRDLDLE